MAASHVQEGLEKDIALTLLLTPLWWVLGLNVIIYQLATGVVFFKFLNKVSRKGISVTTPKPALWLILFLLSYLFSILANSFNHPAERVFASLNNYSVFLMGLPLIHVVYDCDISFLRVILKINKTLCLFSSGLTIFLMGVWFFIQRDLEMRSLLGYLAPSLLDSPFGHIMLMMRLVTWDQWYHQGFPRVALYSYVHTAFGGFMLMIIPLMMAYYRLRQQKFKFWVMTIFSIVPLFFSLSRTVLCAFIAAFIFVYFIERGKKLYFASIFLFIGLLASRHLYSLFEWILNARISSTESRFVIYRDALQLAFTENIFFGIGIRIQSDYYLMQLGSHSTYIGLILVTGIVGCLLFLLFQLHVFLMWYQQRKWVKDQERKTIWKYLGVSYVGVSIWFVTDNLDALPFIAYTYFLIVSLILLFNRELVALRRSHDDRSLYCGEISSSPV